MLRPLLEKHPALQGGPEGTGRPSGSNKHQQTSHRIVTPSYLIHHPLPIPTVWDVGKILPHLVLMAPFKVVLPQKNGPFGSPSSAPLAMDGHMVVREQGNHHESSAPFHHATVKKAYFSRDSLTIDMEIKFPHREKKKPVKNGLRWTQNTGSILSNIFTEQRRPEPVYFQGVDCVAFPNFLSHRECGKIVEFAEAQGFSMQNRHRLLKMMWTDVVDPFFAESLWQICGLSHVLRSLMIDGEVPCGLNDVIRVQKFGKGGLFGRHTDQPVTRADGRKSKYSLRIFLNGKEDGVAFSEFL